MAAAVSSAEPEKLFSYAGTLQPMDAAHVSYANGLAQVLASFESSCTEYSVRVGHLADAMRSHGNRCDVTDGWVRSVGDKFVWADQSAVVPTPIPGPTAPGEYTDWLGRLVEWWRAVGEPAAAGLIVAASMHGGKGGEIVINLPDWLRTVFGISLRDVRRAAGINPYLTHIQPRNLPGSMARFGLIVSVPVIAYKWVEDFRAYEGSERVAAMATDAALVLIPIGLSYAAGVGIAALAGLAVFASVPAVVVGGAIVLASVAIGVGFNWGADKWGLRDKAIGWVKGGLDWAGEQLDAAGDWLSETAENGLAWVDDHVFKPVSDKITGFWQHSWDLIDAAARELQQRFETVAAAIDAVPTPAWSVAAPGFSGVVQGPAVSIGASDLLGNAGDMLRAIWQRMGDFFTGREQEEEPPGPDIPPQPPSETPVSDAPSGGATIPNPPYAYPDVRKRIYARNVDAPLVWSKGGYQARGDDTYCNMFAMDIAHDFGAQLPEYLTDVDDSNDIDKYLDANRMIRWLAGRLRYQDVGVSSNDQTSKYVGTRGGQQGPEVGWKTVSQSEAAEYAAKGYLVIVGWEDWSNIEKPGHMAVVRPDQENGSMIVAQAGGENYASIALEKAFPEKKCPAPPSGNQDHQDRLEFFVFVGEPDPIIQGKARKVAQPRNPEQATI